MMYNLIYSYYSVTNIYKVIILYLYDTYIDGLSCQYSFYYFTYEINDKCTKLILLSLAS